MFHEQHTATCYSMGEPVLFYVHAWTLNWHKRQYVGLFVYVCAYVDSWLYTFDARQCTWSRQNVTNVLPVYFAQFIAFQVLNIFTMYHAF